MSYYKTLHTPDICKVFLLHQIWIVNYHVKSQSKNLSDENINAGVSMIFKTKSELKCQNKKFFWTHQFLCFHYWEFLFGTFDVIIDNPCIFDVAKRRAQKDCFIYSYNLFYWPKLETSHLTLPNPLSMVVDASLAIAQWSENWLNACQNCTTTWVTLQFATSRWAIFFTSSNLLL